MLTGRQREIFDFLSEYVRGHGYPPTVREIGEAVGLASPSTVHAHRGGRGRKPDGLTDLGTRRRVAVPAHVLRQEVEDLRAVVRSASRLLVGCEHTFATRVRDSSGCRQAARRRRESVLTTLRRLAKKTRAPITAATRSRPRRVRLPTSSATRWPSRPFAPTSPACPSCLVSTNGRVPERPRKEPGGRGYNGDPSSAGGGIGRRARLRA